MYGTITMMLDSYVRAFEGEEHRAFRLNGGGHAAALLIHGFPGTPAEMRPVADVLHAAGWTTHGLLLPGFGADITTLAERTHADWLAAVRAAYDDLRRQHDPVMIVGNSMGGALALELAATTAAPPDYLTLFAPFWKIDRVLWRLLPVISILFPQPRLFRYLKLDFDQQDVRDGIHNFMPDADLDDPAVRQAILDYRLPVAMFTQIYHAGRAAHRLAPRLTMPVLAFQGMQDELVRPDLTRRLLSRLNGAVDLREVPGEHNLLQTDQPAWPTIHAEMTAFASGIAQPYPTTTLMD